MFAGGTCRITGRCPGDQSYFVEDVITGSDGGCGGSNGFHGDGTGGFLGDSGLYQGVGYEGG